MLDRKCNFCGSGFQTFRYRLNDWVTKRPGDYHLVECNNCGLLYLYPRPSWEQLKTFYPTEYPSYGVDKNIIRRYIKDTVWRRRYKIILKKKKRGRILDIGCASGNFLAKMSQDLSWECYGVEPISYAAQLARQVPKTVIFEGMLHEAQFPDLYFDVITAWDVIEHTESPADLLQEIYRILKPDGLLVIRIPNPESSLAKLFGPYWVGFDAPRHLFTFPKSVLINYLIRIGFKKVEISHSGGDHFPFFASLSALLLAKGKVKMSRFAEFVAYSSLFRVVLAPIFLSAGKLGINSSLVYLAWKQNQNHQRDLENDRNSSSGN